MGPQKEGRVRRSWLRLSALLAIACLGLIGAGCGSSSNTSGSSSGGTPQPGGTLTIVRAVDSATMDPAYAYTPDDVFVINQIFQPLFAASPDGKSVVPVLAQSYTKSDGGKTLTVKLRPGVKFSNGQPLTSADVKYSLERITGLKDSPFGYLIGVITSVDATDPQTAVIHLSSPWAPILADLSAWVADIVPADLDGKSAKAFFAHPVGTGPFKLQKWVPGQEVDLVKNTGYWQKGKPYLGAVDWKVVPDANTRVSELQAGQAQVASGIPFSQISPLNSAGTTDAKAFPYDFTSFLIFNEHVKPYADVHVRRAIGYALNRPALANAVLFGAGQPACSLMPPTMKYYVAATPCLKYDMSKAQSELAQSSAPNGFSTQLLVENDPAYLSTAQIVQSELKPLKINISIKVVPSSQLYTILGKGQYQMGMAAWASDIPDPDEQISYMLDPAAGGNSYYTYYDNKALSTLIEKAEVEQDDAARADLYKQIQEIQATDVPQVMTTYQGNPYAWNTKVQNLQVNPLGVPALQDVWLGD